MPPDNPSLGKCGPRALASCEVLGEWPGLGIPVTSDLPVLLGSGPSCTDAPEPLAGKEEGSCRSVNTSSVCQLTWALRVWGGSKAEAKLSL